MLFKEDDIKKILNHEKTMTRRPHKVNGYQIGKVYCIRSNRFKKAEHYVLITRKFSERLGDISSKDVQKEGYRSFDAFKVGWIKRVGAWKPKQIVMVYEFEVYT